MKIARIVTEVCVRGWAWANLLTLVFILPTCIVAFPFYKTGASQQTSLAAAAVLVGVFHLWRAR